ncbi:uncharacterized protein CDAR_249791 [Caerostris darwini]|uniref:Fibroblast growth factor n=1 Tax=Caerostris darwini TaxID=1538125 RepID=A0AAV4UTQ0_9ARAC|nr:uncharacterized protein CDAR_249791 [Caerostris darwini]
MAWLLWWWLLSIICVADCIRDIRKMSQTRKGFLRCRTGVTLEMYPDGVVNGTRGKGGKYALLQINVRTRKSVIFFGVRSKQYLCMSNSGMLYGDIYHDCNFDNAVKVMAYGQGNCSKFGCLMVHNTENSHHENRVDLRQFVTLPTK